MNFTLYYRGQLKANGSPEDKHKIRRVFHKQMAKLWLQPPLSECRKWLQPPGPNEDYSFLRSRGAFQFAPLVTQTARLFAELDIVLLRPEPPGKLLTQGGDIDNRLKTLFDALTIPPQENSLPAKASPEPDETPFFCVLEDDSLVTSVAIRATQLLEPNIDKSEIILMIGVRVGRTITTFGNAIFGCAPLGISIWLLLIPCALLLLAADEARKYVARLCDRAD